MSNTMTPQKDDKWVIDLDQVMREHPTDIQAQLYKDEVNQILQMIYDHSYSKNMGNNDDDNNEIIWQSKREYFNISILGSRGCGKTTLLLTVLNLLKRLSRNDNADGPLNIHTPCYETIRNAIYKGTGKEKKTLPKKPIVCGIIEPSHMESQENMAVNIFSLLLSKAQKHLIENPPKTDSDIRLADDLIQLAEEINRHLPIMFGYDRLEHAFKESGNEGLYDEIVNFRSGSTLERKLSDFVKLLLELLDGQLLIVGIDDVDLVCNHGENALESLRCYFTSPRILFIIAGDLNMFDYVMYGSFIRKLQGTNKQKPSNPGHPIDSGDSIFIKDLVGQYLKKILPIQYRILLRTHLSDKYKDIELSGNFEDSPLGFLNLCKRMLINLGLAKTTDSGQQLLNTYSTLIPRDLRQFMAFCWIGVNHEQHLLSSLFHLWSSVLHQYGIDSILMSDFEDSHHFGRKILNLVIHNEMLDPQILNLDTRTDEERSRVAISFLRLLLEIKLRSNPAIESLNTMLDYFIPSYYLSSFEEENRLKVARDFQTGVLDSQRRLYTRVTTRIGKTHWISPGIVRITDKFGAFEKMLDIQSNRHSSVWNTILSEFCKGAVGNECDEDRFASVYEFIQGSQPHERTERSGFNWVTKLLPSIKTGSSVKSEKEVETLNLSIAEKVTTPNLFSNLSGSLPRTILKIWTISEGDQTYLSFWKGLCLIQKCILAIHNNIKPQGTKQCSKKERFHAIHEASRNFLDREGGVSSSSYDSGEGVILDFDKYRDSKFEENSFYKDWLQEWIKAHEFRWKSSALFPFIKEKTVVWIAEPVLPAEARSNEKSKNPIHSINNGVELESCRSEAMDQTIGKLSACINDWASFWELNGIFNENQSDLISLAEIQSTITSFLDDLNNEVTYCENWSGVGDILQRWICNFLNSLLIETMTLKPKKSKEVPQPSTPKLLRSTSIKSPPRNLNGSIHPLYSNLKILEKHSSWKPSELFYFLYSCPIFAMLLPKVEQPDYKPFRDSMLKPNIALDQFRNGQSFALDLAGLSWRGLDLCSKNGEALEDINERQTALIEMLNSMMADVEPSKDCKPHLSYLAAIVYAAIDEKTQKQEQPVTGSTPEKPPQVS